MTPATLFTDESAIYKGRINSIIVSFYNNLNLN